MVTESLKLTEARNPKSDTSILVNVTQSQTRGIGFPLGKFPTEVELCGERWNTGPMKKQIMHNITKKWSFSELHS